MYHTENMLFGSKNACLFQFFKYFCGEQDLNVEVNNHKQFLRLSVKSHHLSYNYFLFDYTTITLPILGSIVDFQSN